MDKKNIKFLLFESYVAVFLGILLISMAIYKKEYKLIIGGICLLSSGIFASTVHRKTLKRNKNV